LPQYKHELVSLYRDFLASFLSGEPKTSGKTKWMVKTFSKVLDPTMEKLDDDLPTLKQIAHDLQGMVEAAKRDGLLEA